MSTLSTCQPGNLYNFKIKDHLHNCFLIFKLKYQLAYFYFRQGDSAVAPKVSVAPYIGVHQYFFLNDILFILVELCELGAILLHRYQIRHIDRKLSRKFKIKLTGLIIIRGKP